MAVKPVSFRLVKSSESVYEHTKYYMPAVPASCYGDIDTAEKGKRRETVERKKEVDTRQIS